MESNNFRSAFAQLRSLLALLPAYNMGYTASLHYAQVCSATLHKLRIARFRYTQFVHGAQEILRRYKK